MVDRLLASVVPGGMAAVLALALIAGPSPAQAGALGVGRRHQEFEDLSCISPADRPAA